MLQVQLDEYVIKSQNISGFLCWNEISLSENLFHIKYFCTQFSNGLDKILFFFNFFQSFYQAIHPGAIS